MILYDVIIIFSYSTSRSLKDVLKVGAYHHYAVFNIMSRTVPLQSVDDTYLKDIKMINTLNTLNDRSRNV